MRGERYRGYAKTPAQNSPENEFKSGSVSATIWSNDRDGKAAYKSVSLQRRYKDREGEWKFSKSLWVDDLPHAVAVLLQAIIYFAFKSSQTVLGQYKKT